MSSQYHGVVVVVPTRNRADLAENAIRSVLRHDGKDIRVLVSDNSTTEEDLDRLSAFCEQCADPRLHYLRPPTPLAMSEHWEWAATEALRRSDATHCVYLTDRMMFKPGALRRVLEIVRRHPGDVVSYCHDRVDDDRDPVRVYQAAWSAQLVRVDSESLLRLTSQASLHPSLPRMLNCVVPRVVLETMWDRFGTIFDSAAPDFSFCFKCLYLLRTIVYFDSSPIFHYSLNRSNGASADRGIPSADHTDFVANLNSEAPCFATPIPQLMTTWNAIAHEYCVAQRRFQSSLLPDLHPERYLGRVFYDVDHFQDPERQAQMRALIAGMGLTRESPRSRIARLVPKVFSRERVRRHAVSLLVPAVSKPMWRFLESRFGAVPPHGNRFEFATPEEAIAYVETHQGMRRASRAHVRLEGRVLGHVFHDEPPVQQSDGDASATSRRQRLWDKTHTG